MLMNDILANAIPIKILVALCVNWQVDIKEPVHSPKSEIELEDYELLKKWLIDSIVQGQE